MECVWKAFWEMVQMAVLVKQDGKEKSAINASHIGTVRIKMSTTWILRMAWHVCYPISAGVKREVLL
jgi:hypothetical protein